MTIAFSCACGATFKVEDSAAGKKRRCPRCAMEMTVPEADPLELKAPEPPQRVFTGPAQKAQFIEETVIYQQPSSASPVVSRYKRGVRFFIEGRQGAWLKIQTVTGKDGFIPAATKYRIVREAAEGGDDGQISESKALNSGMWGGIACMAGAVVWFVVGWMAGYIFFYPPILFVVGLISFFKGIANRG